MNKQDREQIEKGLSSIPMTIIMKLKRQLTLMLILNIILAVSLIVSVYDSISIRDSYWQEHTQMVVEKIHQHCESERASWQD